MVRYELLMDSVIAIAVIVAYRILTNSSNKETFLNFLGKHSFNIFLFHTFLFGLYTPELIYWNRDPLIIFMTLLAFCIILSVALEWVKKATRFNDLLKKLIDKTA